MFRNLSITRCLYAILLTVSVLVAGRVSAQELEILRFEMAPMDLTAATHAVKDFNGQNCALIKVQVPREGVGFEGNIVRQEFHINEYWVYVIPGTKLLQIKHPDAFPRMVEFAAYDIPAVDSAVTYVMTLKVSSEASAAPGVAMQNVIVDVVPADALVILDGKMLSLQGGKGTVSLPVDKEYHYTVATRGYYPVEGSIRLTSNAPGQLIARLVPLRESAAQSAPVSPASQSTTPSTPGSPSVSLAPSVSNDVVYLPGQRATRKGIDMRYGYIQTLPLRLQTADSIFEREQYAKAFPILEEFKDDPYAQILLGEMYLRGYGVVADQAISLEWFRKVLESDGPEKEYVAGIMEDPYSVFSENKDKKDRSKCLLHYTKAAEAGLPVAQRILGATFAWGLGVKKDAVLAKKWLSIAFENGNMFAPFLMGLYHEIPVGTAFKKDMNEAFRWYEIVAKAGVPFSQQKLGEMYYKGNGCKKDRDEAYRWFKLAYDNGCKSAKEWLDKYK